MCPRIQRPSLPESRTLRLAMASEIQEIAERIAALASRRIPLFVGLDGGAGAGKTTFANALAKRLRASGLPVSVVKTDLFFRPTSERWPGSADDMPIGHDLDWERVRDEVITPLREGRGARFQLYDWEKDGPGAWQEIEPIGVVIIDGVFSLRNELAGLYDLRIWLRCPRATRVSRLLGRGDTPQDEIDAWLPVEDRYLKAHKPENAADLVIDSTAQDPDALR